jgi:phosphate transport system protein
MAEHTVKAFDDDITRLRGLIAEMGGLAEVAISDAMEALVKGREALADEVLARDKRIDAFETALRSASSRCAHQWPTTCAR